MPDSFHEGDGSILAPGLGAWYFTGGVLLSGNGGIRTDFCFAGPSLLVAGACEGVALFVALVSELPWDCRIFGESFDCEDKDEAVFETLAAESNDEGNAAKLDEPL